MLTLEFLFRFIIALGLIIIIVDLLKKLYFRLIPKKNNFFEFEKNYEFYDSFFFKFILFLFFLFYFLKYIIIFLIFLILFIFLIPFLFKFNKQEKFKSSIKTVFFKITKYLSNKFSGEDVRNENDLIILSSKTEIGSYWYKTDIEKSMQIYSFAKINFSEFEEEVTFFGTVLADKTTFEKKAKFFVFELKLNNCKFEDDLIIFITNKNQNIFISIENCKFEKNIIIYGMSFFDLSSSCKIEGEIIYKKFDL